MFTVLVIALSAVGADQLFKWLALEYLKPVSSFNIIRNVLELHYVENRGAAFGILVDNKIMLVGFTAVLIIALAFFLVKNHGRHLLLKTGVSLIVSGGLGNLIDRIFRGFVVDYIYFVPINFPVFNLADICITSGTALVLIYVLFFDAKDSKKAKPEKEPDQTL
ncbi:MAG: signal peptidase II [Oscillospiraceae bacterium]|nr:signal peptidase II [Oscillospiraceae bacterium]